MTDDDHSPSQPIISTHRLKSACKCHTLRSAINNYNGSVTATQRKMVQLTTIINSEYQRRPYKHRLHNGFM